jgi:hypothetical protein
MNALLFSFALLQAVGSVVGAGGAVFAEIFYLRAIQDGTIDDAERAHLRIVANALRWGMLILLVGSIGLVLTDFIYDVPVQPALTHAYWIEMGLAFAIIFFSWALSRRRVGFIVSSAAVFAGWWFMALLVFGRLPYITFGAAAALYVVTTAVIAALLFYVRIFIVKPAV